MHHPGQVVGYKNSKKFKRLDLFQDTAARSNGRALETIIMEKVKRHDLTFEGLRHILLLTAYACTSDTMCGKIDSTFLGIISITVRSSTNLARGSQRRIRSLAITANSSGPKRVPWGMPRLTYKVVRKITTCDLPKTVCTPPSQVTSEIMIAIN